MRPASGRRTVTAMPSASTTRSALRSSRIDQPTMRFVKTSMTAGGKSQPSQVGTTLHLPGPVKSQGLLSVTIGSGPPDCPIT